MLVERRVQGISPKIVLTANGVIRTHNLLIRSQMVRLFTQTEPMTLGRRVDSSSEPLFQSQAFC